MLGVIDVRQRKLMGSFIAHERTIKSLCVVNGQLVSGSADGEVKIWPLVDFFNVDGPRLQPSFRTLVCETKKEAVVQMQSTDDGIYVADMFSIKKFYV
jgi:WD40 repeat protein